MKRAIEEYFPIVEINRLAVPERNAFKPIYQMHKWFARRSSSVFRAILLGAMKPAGTDIMAEFYKDHTNDPDTKDKVILDPFMGGGTTVVEALRLGCKVIGIDLNPVAWFIVKTEVEPVDIEELKQSFERLSERKVGWSGNTLKETLLDLYKTECPACGNKHADIIYTFWVKSAPCTTATCKAYTPLFSDYIIAQKKPSIRYFPDCTCPECDEKFDWEKEPAALVGEEKLMVTAPKFSAGEGRTSARWAFSNDEIVNCPWCEKKIKPKPKSSKRKRKKVELAVLLCPSCEEVWQYRGPLPDPSTGSGRVACPTCKHKYNPMEGNIPDKGEFICKGACGGNKDKIIAAIRTLPEDKLLPTKPYALEGYCEKCAPKREEKKAKDPNQADLFENGEEDENSEIETDDKKSIISKNNGKFFKRFSSADFAEYKTAGEVWEKEKVNLPYPKSEIPEGAETKRLLEHHYRYWHRMFNSRQLLALSTLLKGIDEEENQTMKEMLLSAYQMSLEANNMFARYRQDSGGRSPFGGVFSRHDYQPKTTPCEINVFGPYGYYGTYNACFGKVMQGKEFSLNPYDRRFKADEDGLSVLKNNVSIEKIAGNNDNLILFSQSSSQLELPASISNADFVVTDPPYAGNVNYSELADFFYVWLRLILKKTYPHFNPEYTPKSEEVIENRTRNKTAVDFQNGLTQVFREAYRVSKLESPLIFTFHHAEGSAWESLLSAVCDSGYYVEAVYPIHGEAENSLHLMDNEAISYDLIHVCKKRENGGTSAKRSWAGVRHEIRQRAREEARLIEKGRYGNEPLSPADINILLIGKCLELYSKHYGAIVDHEDRPVPIKRALEEIKVLIDQIASKEQPLPAELMDIDTPSYIYFTTLCEKREIKSDDINKSTRGIIEPAELHKWGLVRKGREKRGRTIEVKQPIERLDELREKFKDSAVNTQLEIFDVSTPLSTPASIIPAGILFIDYVHFLLGLAQAGENIFPWVEKFRGLRPQIQAACEYLALRNRAAFESPVKKILGLIDERSLFSQKG